ncbi:tetratricopeptide repeat protein [Stakelama marina]|uniref:Tetratricopeptide repeat protein n=1 Tax=Stakelama marina TaxID=2826939 RepID=A0A8T4IFV3_9SPHN|nr:tetratricopeptide repeat protein [Stakelama marina]MBR0553440.1 tetratricopeptide repeat protein [Stakelama marina]
MILPLLLAIQTNDIGPLVTDQQRYSGCIQMAAENPIGAQSVAMHWRDAGGGFHALHCLAVAYANAEQWSDAAAAFGDAADAAQNAQDRAAAGQFRAQAGNAWLLAGDPDKARIALGAAVTAGVLQGDQLANAHIDLARAEVALGDSATARTDLDAAIKAAPNNALAWLLSATLARRTGDMRRAQQDIAVAKTKAPQDPAVYLEAGNIAARLSDEAEAKAAWNKVVALAPASPQAASAKNALAQFDGAPAGR